MNEEENMVKYNKCYRIGGKSSLMSIVQERKMSNLCTEKIKKEQIMLLVDSGRNIIFLIITLEEF